MPPLLLCPLPSLSRPPRHPRFLALPAPPDPRFSPLDVERNAATLPGPNSRVAQLVEQAAVNRRVPGSSPGSGATLHVGGGVRLSGSREGLASCAARDVPADRGVTLTSS